MKQTVMENERMKAKYEALVMQFTQTHGEITEAAETLIVNIAYLEGPMEEAMKSLNTNGLSEKYQFSSYKTANRENKSLGQMLKIQAQQAKLLRELRLLPGSKKAADCPEDDGEEDDLNDY